MVKGLASTMILAGVTLLGVSAYQLVDRESHQVVEQRRLESALRTGGSAEGGTGRATGARTRAARGVAWGRLEIPDVGLSVAVEDGTDRPTLRRSVGHLPDTAYPGEIGNVVLAGHRDGLFRPLKDVKPGQRLRITTTDGAFDYAIVSTEVVAPSRVDRIAPGLLEEVTLVTCYPFYFVGPAPDRFLVKARRRQPGGRAGADAGRPDCASLGTGVSPEPGRRVVDSPRPGADLEPLELSRLRQARPQARTPTLPAVRPCLPLGVGGDRRALARPPRCGRSVRAVLGLAVPRAPRAAGRRVPLVPQGDPTLARVAAAVSRVRPGVPWSGLGRHRVALARGARRRHGVRGLPRLALPGPPRLARPRLRLPAPRLSRAGRVPLGRGVARYAGGRSSNRHSTAPGSPIGTARIATPNASAGRRAAEDARPGEPSAAIRPSSTSAMRGRPGRGAWQVVDDGEDRDALLAHVVEHAEEVELVAHVEVRRRLVEEEHGRLLREAAGDERELPLAGGERPERPVAQVLDLRQPQRARDRGVVRGGERGERRRGAGSGRARRGRRRRGARAPRPRRPRGRRAARATAARGQVGSGRPSRRTSPPAAGSRPASARTSVDLPAAFGPTRARRLARRAARGRRRRSTRRWPRSTASARASTSGAHPRPSCPRSARRKYGRADERGDGAERQLDVTARHERAARSATTTSTAPARNEAGSRCRPSGPTSGRSACGRDEADERHGARDRGHRAGHESAEPEDEDAARAWTGRLSAAASSSPSESTSSVRARSRSASDAGERRTPRRERACS